MADREELAAQIVAGMIANPNLVDEDDLFDDFEYDGTTIADRDKRPPSQYAKSLLRLSLKMADELLEDYAPTRRPRPWTVNDRVVLVAADGYLEESNLGTILQLYTSEGTALVDWDGYVASNTHRLECLSRVTVEEVER